MPERYISARFVFFGILAISRLYISSSQARSSFRLLVRKTIFLLYCLNLSNSYTWKSGCEPQISSTDMRSIVADFSGSMYSMKSNEYALLTLLGLVYQGSIFSGLNGLVWFNLLASKRFMFSLKLDALYQLSAYFF